MAYQNLFILCFGQVANVFLGSVGAVLYMTNNERKALKALAVALCINIILLFILIPYYQDVAWADLVLGLRTICSECN